MDVVRIFLAVFALMGLGMVHPAWAASTNSLVFIREGHVWIARTDGSAPRELVTMDGCGAPAITPDGTRVAFHAGMDETSGYGRIHTVSASGGTPEPLRIGSFQGTQYPAFSADGKSLLFVGLSHLENNAAEQSIYASMTLGMLDLATGSLHPIAEEKNVNLDGGYLFAAPAVAPDGNRVVYQESGSDVSGGFVVLNLQGKELFRHPSDPEDFRPYWTPQFSPDGQRMLCSSPSVEEGEPDTVWLVSLKTGEIEPVTEGTGATFVEGGKALVFERWKNRWSASQEATCDLWRLDLTPGASPTMILENAEQPASQ